jgi:hypothetical protein
MNKTEMLEKIAEKDFIVDDFVRLARDQRNIRDEIVNQMLTNPDIMVYYHCYYVVSKGSEKNPEIYYSYWNEIAGLLNHKNSYHRDIGLEIIANLTAADKKNQFSDIENDYFACINDVKFSTGQCCVKNCKKIYRYKTEQRGKIISLLLDIDNLCDYPEKQLGLLKFEIIELFDEIYDSAIEKDRINQFVRVQLRSPSPKTRKKAREFISKFNLMEA